MLKVLSFFRYLHTLQSLVVIILVEILVSYFSVKLQQEFLFFKTLQFLRIQLLWPLHTVHPQNVRFQNVSFAKRQIYKTSDLQNACSSKH